MGQGGSSELRLSSASESLTEPPLRWLRVSRASSSSLAAEWRWSAEPAGRVGRCHLLFLRSDAAWRAHRPMQRVEVDPSLGGYTMANLSADSPYRVCLQCAAAGANLTLGEARGKTPEAMHCVNVSTKQAHLPAIIGSCLGALCALILVLVLVLLSRRTQKYRKVNERQTVTTKKVVVHEITYQTDNLPTPKIELDSNSDGYVYDGSEEQQGSTVSDDGLTPPPHPPPPPPSLSMATETATPEKDKDVTAASEKPELDPLLPAKDPQQEPPPTPLPPDVLSANSSTEDTANSASPAPSDLRTPSPSQPAAQDTDAGTGASLPISTLADCRQVIQVNETDEYSIDLRLCNSLSRQQSLRAASASGSSTGAGSARTDDLRAAAASSDSTVQCRESQQDTATVSSAPSLYTQLIETL